MTLSQLRPCPHCGRTVNFEYVPGDSYCCAHLKVWCGAEFNTLDSCGAYFQFDIDSEQDCIKRFNTRVPDPTLIALLERAEKLLGEMSAVNGKQGLEAMQLLSDIAELKGGET
jgi:hypothetical protein